MRTGRPECNPSPLNFAADFNVFCTVVSLLPVLVRGPRQASDFVEHYLTIATEENHSRFVTLRNKGEQL